MDFDKHIPFDKGLQIPKRKHPPFLQMEVHDSLFVVHNGSILKCPAYVYAATIQKRTNKRYRFAGRSVVENGVKGVRIWRVA